jgi:hypothetical protein
MLDLKFVSDAPSIGIAGTRKKSKTAIDLFDSFFMAVPREPKKVHVGCAKGIDEYARNTFDNCVVHEVEGPRLPYQFALRTKKMVEAIKLDGGFLLCFPNKKCPDGLSVSNPFSGKGSGTWGACAYALKIKLPVFVVVSDYSGFGDCIMRLFFTPIGELHLGGYLYACPRALRLMY